MSDITTCVDGNRHGYVSPFVSKREMTTRLTVFFEAVRFEKAEEVLRRNLGHSPHQGTATVNSST